MRKQKLTSTTLLRVEPSRVQDMEQSALTLVPHASQSSSDPMGNLGGGYLTIASVKLNVARNRAWDVLETALPVSHTVSRSITLLTASICAS